MIYAVFGPRDFPTFGIVYENYEHVKKCLLTFTDIDMLVVGGAPGVELLAERFADEHSIKKVKHHPKIRQHGLQEGFALRNQRMIEVADRLIMFWDGMPADPLMTILAQSMIAKKEVTLIPME